MEKYNYFANKSKYRNAVAKEIKSSKLSEIE